MTAREEIRLVAMSENDRDALTVARRLAAQAAVWAADNAEADSENLPDGYAETEYQTKAELLEAIRNGAGAFEPDAVVLCLDAMSDRFDSAEVVR